MFGDFEFAGVRSPTYAPSMEQSDSNQNSNLAQTSTFWQKFASIGWFVRGVAGLFAILTLVPNYSDFHQGDILLVFHFLISKWNNVLEFVGHIIGEVTFLPTLTAAFLNTISLGLLLLPSFIYTISLAKDDMNFLIMAGPIVMSIGFLMIFYEYQLSGQGVFEYYFDRSTRGEHSDQPFNSGFVPIAFITALFIIILILTFIYSKPIRYAACFVLGVIVTSEVLFFAGQPEFRNLVLDHTCQELKVDVEECVSRESESSAPNGVE